MIIRRITINGQHYGSPDDMPPDVRRAYEAALQAVAPRRAGDPASETTHAITGPNASLVTRTMVSVKHGKAGELPPDVRRSLNSGAPGTVRTFVRLENPPPEQPVPIEAGSAQAKARQFLANLIFWVIVALVLWAFLDR
jgi:hypothetical protein